MVSDGVQAPETCAHLQQIRGFVSGTVSLVEVLASRITQPRRTKMPLVNISLRKGATAAHRRAIADGIHLAMMDAMEIPTDDRFQLVHEFAAENMIQHRTFFGIERSEKSVFIQIVVNHRDVSQKMKVYELIVDNLGKNPGLRKEDIFIGIVEVARENWWAFARHADGDGMDARAATK